ncbi:MAG: exonuclease SbcCD subunit D C-terminal domain-containing protein [Sphaerochaetaceae bacterium]
MRLLHTSDWHLGKTLYDKRRHHEHEAFLVWLLTVLKDQAIDVLLICGDIFDTVSPSNAALQLYYDFLRKAHDQGCRYIIVTGGNHDSPSLLEAPAAILQPLQVHVVGAKPKEVEQQLVVVRNEGGKPEAIVCAVPFLRDRDVRQFVENEDSREKDQRLINGIAEHYQQVHQAAHKLREELSASIPIIHTGHLFAAGASAGEGVRDLYVGTAIQLNASLFPQEAAYIALGHLHKKQRVGSTNHIYYSGSPLPMGFSELGRAKEVLIVEFEAEALVAVNALKIPQFQTLVSIVGDEDELIQHLNDLLKQNKSIWVEATCSTPFTPSLRLKLQEIVQDSLVELLRINTKEDQVDPLLQSLTAKTLEELDEKEVFLRRLDQENLTQEQQKHLITLYQEVLHAIWEKEIS